MWILGELFLHFQIQFLFVGGFVLLNQDQQLKFQYIFHIDLTLFPESSSSGTGLLDNIPPVSLSMSSQVICDFLQFLNVFIVPSFILKRILFFFWNYFHSFALNPDSHLWQVFVEAYVHYLIQGKVVFPLQLLNLGDVLFINIY